MRWSRRAGKLACKRALALAALLAAAAVVAATGALLAGCAPLGPGGKDVVRPVERSMNGVKAISAAVASGDDPSTYGQAEYRVSPDSRLLLRFEELSSQVDRVRVDGSHTVRMRLHLGARSSGPGSGAVLELCPLLRDWMMLATWDAAHPFGRGGAWARPGGDLDESGCGRHLSPPPADLPEDALEFDVTGWFRDYLLARGVNYGLALVARSGEARVVGETSGSRSPRLLWEETQGGAPR